MTGAGKEPWRCPRLAGPPGHLLWSPRVCSGVVIPSTHSVWTDTHLSTVHWGAAWLPSSARASVAQPSSEPAPFSFYSQTGIISLYDCIFKRNPGYNQKLHRDDREHAKSLGLHVNEEVMLREAVDKALTD